MKKIIAINCSCRKDGNTAQMLNSALKGAAQAGAETRLIHLGDLHFGGCRSCFACKRKDIPTTGICAFQDDLTPILQEINTSCDGLFIGTPIYFSGESGLCRNFIERLFFPVMTYDDFSVSLAPRKFPVAFFYTMNVTKENAEAWGYPKKLNLLPEYAAGKFFDGKPKTLFAYDTWQFDDYSRYNAAIFDVAHKADVRNTQFKNDLAAAFELGASFA